MSNRIDTELALGARRFAGATCALEANWIHIPTAIAGTAATRLLEKELLALSALQSRITTPRDVANYIENYYDLVRLHSHLDYVSPVEREATAST